MRIALLAPPLLPVPPIAYGGTERVVATLATHLHRRGHRLTVFAAGDSRLPCPVVPVVERALWPAGFRGDAAAYLQRAVEIAASHADRFDLLHAHVEWHAFELARRSRVPVLTTIHGRLDAGATADQLTAYPDVPLVAISDSQRRFAPRANWLATIHHGLDFAPPPVRHDGGYLCFLGRVAAEKGIIEAIEVARRVGLRLRIAAKSHEPSETALFERVVAPALDDGTAEFVGELAGRERDELLAGARATLMLGDWPEPFGLVAIESLAVGTPVIGRPVGALPEIIRHGRDGWLVDDLAEAAAAVGRLAMLAPAQQTAISARLRFAADRMVDAYERLFESVCAAADERAARPVATTGRLVRPDADVVPSL
ncbi:MAG TPA: glycosyltransferase family 4 protein [Candidatus Limnocylindria bacterium]|nr:glycosyltransferase family 4 protein [Candidatus Limnocylindria bacterium]